MRVSVVIPTFDRANRVVAAVESALDQSLPALEVIVVDDGSTDGTAAALEQAFGDTIEVLRKDNGGVSSARNLGVARARAPWIAFLDSDDVWHRDKLERQAEAWSRAPEHRIIHCDEVWIRKGRRVNPRRRHAKKGGRIFLHCLPGCAISPSAVVIERRLLAELGGFDEDLPACEDYDLWLRVCAREPVLYVPERLLTKTGGHADQLSTTVWGLDRFRIRALERCRDDPSLTNAERKALLRELDRKIAVFAAGARKRGRIEEAEDYERRRVARSAS